MLSLVFFLLSGVGAGLLCGLSDTSFWWFLPLWIGFYLGVSLLFFLSFILLSTLFSLGKSEKPRRSCRRLLHIYAAWALGFLLVRVKKENFEKLPEGPIVLVANHRSNFDPVVLMALSIRDMVYISKESNFRIPFVGKLIAKAGSLPIDRENGMRALRTLKHAAELVRDEGLSVGIYPEGTRNKTDELLEFKDGAFYLAKKANVPVAVVRTEGTERIFPIKRHGLFLTVRVTLLDVWQPAFIAEKSLPELAALAHDTVAAVKPKI